MEPESEVTDLSVSDEKSSSSNIPAAVFVEDVDEFMSRPNNDSAAKVIKSLDEQRNKYKFMEVNLLAKKKRLRSQLPDLERSLESVRMLKQNSTSKDDMICNFLLSEQVYSEAKIYPTDTVFLWLGANVMLEYPLDEAADLLTKNIDGAKKNIELIEKELNFLRSQRTITEVNMARLFNWDIKRRQSVEASTREQN